MTANNDNNSGFILPIYDNSENIAPKVGIKLTPIVDQLIPVVEEIEATNRKIRRIMNNTSI